MRKIIGATVLVTVGAIAFQSCMPRLLDKYRRGPETQAVTSPESQSASVTTDAPNVMPTERGTRESAPSIVAINDRTFRFNLAEGDVWDSALNVLLQNYALTIVDRETGVITTEWDSYFNDRAVYRNKISMRVRKLSFRTVEVTILNNLERLQDAAQAGSLGAIWLPSRDDGRETGRIVRNMAVALGQSVPQLPGNLAARDPLSDESEQAPR